MENHIKAIDYWANPFDESGIQKFRESEMLAYSFELFHMSARLEPGKGLAPAEFLTELDEAGVEKAIIPAFVMGNARGSLEMECTVAEIHALIKDHPSRLYGLYGINPLKGSTGLSELEEAINTHHFVGAHLHPYGFDKPPSHRLYYPYYAKCSELGIPLVVQTGHSAEFMPNECGQPIHLDRVALDFPDLRIVAAHTGWPWVEELISIAWKHPNVFIGTSAHAPKYLPCREYGSLFHFMNSRGIGKVLFGTDRPVLHPKEAIQQVRALPLKEEAREKYLRSTALSIFPFSQEN